MIMINKELRYLTYQNGNGHKKKLGELLLNKNLISQQQLEAALQKQKELGELLGEILMELGFINEEELFPVIAQQLKVPYLNLRGLNVSPDIIEKVPVRIAHRFQIVPIDFKDNALIVAMAHPRNVLKCDDIRLFVNSEIKFVLTSREDIEHSLAKYYGVGSETIEKILENTDIMDIEKVKELSEQEAIDSEATISNFLNQVFLEAFKARATDIHIEPTKDNLIIRYRVDGMLQRIKVPEEIKYFKNYINSRIKILSNLNIAERRLPQDGHFRLPVNGVTLDLRVSFVPSLFGESIVIRILNPTKAYSFDYLQLADEERKFLENIITRPHGIVFLTGPTGSGKTTTLYSCLSRINSLDRKIITIEDPVEYQLANTTQIQVNPTINFTFAKALRSVLRQNPDVIMVGEVRDIETAEIAIQVALTGHLIFSTLHTNDAVSGVTRLLNMGVPPYLITSTVECFIAQRLVRVLCPSCKYPKKVNPEILKQFNITAEQDVTVFNKKGCPKCNFTGYYGRVAIYEFFPLGEEVHDLILNRANAVHIKEKAVSLGMKTLRQSGWEKVKAGITSLDEIIRVSQERSKRA